MHALAASTFCLLPALLCGLLGAQQPAPDDLVWRTPCSGPEQSMPIGNGEVGCNVWCTADGVLHAYVARTDSFSEASRLLKLGAFEVPLRAPAAGEFFEQRLVLQEGAIRVTIGEGEAKVVATLFVDSEADVVHVTIDSGARRHSELRLRSWRREDRAPARRRAGRQLDDEGRAGGCRGDGVRRRALGAARPGRQERWHCNPPLQSQLGGRVHRGAPRAADDGGSRSAARPHVRPRRRRRRRPPRQPRVATETIPLLTGLRHTTHLPHRHSLPRRRHRRRRTRGTASRRGDSPRQQPQRQGWRTHPRVVAFVLAALVRRRRRRRTTGDPGERALRCASASTAAAATASSAASTRSRSFDAASGGDELFAAKPGKTLPQEVATLRTLTATRGLRITATITQDAQHPIGRIVDKLTAGRNDGFLFDTHPGRSLRLIVGDHELVAKDVLRAGETHEVAATFDAASGRMTITCDGKLVADSEAGANVRVADPAPRSRLTQALALQRWVQACGGRGKFPIKFNGSIFTVEPKPTGGQSHDADMAALGRLLLVAEHALPYYPMLAQGDFDMQAPLFRLYRSTLPAAIARAKAWHGKDGAYWPETMTPFGTHGNGDYGWQRDGVPASKVLCPWWEYCRNQGLELLALMLDRYDFERDPKFFTDELLPIAGPVLQWFANAYPRRDDGTLRLTPTQSLETHWHGVEDDLPTVAGLHWCLHRLRTMAPELVPKEQLAAWDALAKALPPDPRGAPSTTCRCWRPPRSTTRAGRTVRAPSSTPCSRSVTSASASRSSSSRARRSRPATIASPTAGHRTVRTRPCSASSTKRARTFSPKLQNHNRAHRFPAMWGPNFDWCPDQCHGSNLLDTVHRILLQADDDRILLLPCWPKQWNVSVPPARTPPHHRRMRVPRRRLAAPRGDAEGTRTRRRAAAVRQCSAPAFGRPGADRDRVEPKA